MKRERKLYIIEAYENELYELEDCQIYELVQRNTLPKELMLFIGERSKKQLNKIEKIINEK